MNSTITISIPEVVFDIQNKTYLTGRSRDDGSNGRQIAAMQAGNDDPDLNQILRSLQTALGTLIQEFADWLPEGDKQYSNLDLPSLEKDLQLDLDLPSYFNSAVLRGVTDAAHAYLTAYAISEWFGITNKADAQQYTAAAAESIASLRRAMTRRVSPVRRKLLAL